MFNSKITVCIFLLIASTTVNADWSEWGQITTLHVNSGDGGSKRAYLTGLQITNPLCETSNTPVILFNDDPDSPGFGKELLSTAMLSFSTKTEIRAHASKCWSAYSTPVVTAIETR